MGVTVRVGLAVAVGIVVLVGVRVRVGVMVGVAVGGGVAVLVGVGWLPMRTTNCVTGPTVPLVSRTWTATSVSPSANAFPASTTKQNWVTKGSDDTKVGEPNASTVQARRDAVATVKAHPKSLSAFATRWVGPKSKGSKPGTPPSVQT